MEIGLSLSLRLSPTWSLSSFCENADKYQPGDSAAISAEVAA